MRYFLPLFLGLCFLTFSDLLAQIQVEQGMDAVDLVENEEVKILYADKSDPFNLIKKKNFTQDYLLKDHPEYKKVLWLKFSLVNLDYQADKYYLHSRIPYTKIYQETATGWREIKNGYLRPYNQRDVKDNTEFNLLYLPSYQTTTVYLKMQAGNLVESNKYPKIGGKAFYFEQLYQERKLYQPAITFTLIYFSGLVMISFFILILYTSIRESVYLYYLLYLVFQILYSLITFARTPLKFMNMALYFPNLGYILSDTVQFLFIGFYIFFILHLLEIKFKSVLGRVLQGIAWLCFCYAAFSLSFYILFPSPEGRYLVFSIGRILFLPINLIMIVWIAIKVKHPLILYFVIGNLFFFIGAIMSVTVSFLQLNSDPNSIFFFKNSLNTIFQMGLLGEVFCFSFALAHRVRLIQKEKEENAQALIRQLQENKQIQEGMNKELDKKISEKTEELIQVYSDIEKQREKEIKLEFSQKINEMETIALRTQMNPHFLFNSMNAIKHLIMTNRSKDAMYYLDDFSSLLRSVLQNSKRKNITVEDELEILKLYLSLEKNRLGDEFQYEILVDNIEMLSQYPIPGLLLQPFVENAIWHGLSPSDRKEKLLTIRFEEKESLIISIEDNGIGRAASLKKKRDNIRMHQSLGLQITQDRIALFNHHNDIKINLKITDLQDKGMPSGTLITFTYLIDNHDEHYSS